MREIIGLLVFLSLAIIVTIVLVYLCHKFPEPKTNENKDLKEWKKTVVDMFNRTCKCKYLNQEAALCGLSGKQCVAINECMYKKHQALVEIKKYCEDQNLKADFTACEILQIVSEVLNEKEMGNNTSNKTATVQS